MHIMTKVLGNSVQILSLVTQLHHFLIHKLLIQSILIGDLVLFFTSYLVTAWWLLGLSGQSPLFEKKWGRRTPNVLERRGKKEKKTKVISKLISFSFLSPSILLWADFMSENKKQKLEPSLSQLEFLFQGQKAAWASRMMCIKREIESQTWSVISFSTLYNNKSRVFLSFFLHFFLSFIPSCFLFFCLSLPKVQWIIKHSYYSSS